MTIYFLPRSRVKGMQARVLPPDVVVLNVSSRASDGWNVLSPFYDHGGIPVPGMDGVVSRTMEGIWQGLKRFEAVGEDTAMFATGRPKKRRICLDRTKADKNGASLYTGRILGHAYGADTLNGAVEARRKIYIPTYRWMVEHCPKARAKFEELVELALTKTVHVYDFEENGDMGSPKPYAHAALLQDLVRERLAADAKGEALTGGKIGRQW